MSKIFVVRHGEREDYVNEHWRFQYPDLASDDPPLSEKGHEQCREITQRLANEQMDYIISSPYQRCVQTANYIAEQKNMNILIEPGICEVLWTWPPGYKTAVDLVERFPRIEIGYNPVSVPDSVEYGDSDCVDRSAKTALEIYERYRAKSILFVGHGASVAGILKAFLGRLTYVGLCTRSEIVNDSTMSNSQEKKGWKAEFIGDNSHLSDKTNLRAF